MRKLENEIMDTENEILENHRKQLIEEEQEEASWVKRIFRK